MNLLWKRKTKKYGLCVRELNKSTVQQYVAKGIMNMSPPRRGPTPKAPELLFDVLGLHASMMQASEGEATPRHLQAILKALVSNKKFDDLSVHHA